MLDEAQANALRALRDCQVVRADAYSGPHFQLYHAGFSTAEEARKAVVSPDNRRLRHYRLTDKGRRAVALLPRLNEYAA